MPHTSVESRCIAASATSMSANPATWLGPKRSSPASSVVYARRSGKRAIAARFGAPCQPRMSWEIGSTAHRHAASTPARSPQNARVNANTDRIDAIANTQIPWVSTAVGSPLSSRNEP